MNIAQTKPWQQRRERFAAACVRGFHRYANWLIGISWRRFILLSLLFSMESSGAGTKLILLGMFVLVIAATALYGPIASAMVELFPTRVRYTAMSLPYHIGNGWFGGLLPTTAFAIVAQTGNMYNGLWYPIIIAGATVVIGGLFIKETKDVDIYADD